MKTAEEWAIQEYGHCAPWLIDLIRAAQLEVLNDLRNKVKDGRGWVYLKCAVDDLRARIEGKPSPCPYCSTPEFKVGDAVRLNARAQRENVGYLIGGPNAAEYGVVYHIISLRPDNSNGNIIATLCNGFIVWDGFLEHAPK